MREAAKRKPRIHALLATAACSVGVACQSEPAPLGEVLVVVDTDAICAAIKDVFQDTRSVLEPSGALAVAAAKQYAAQHKLRGKTLVAITSGANMNFDRLRFVSDRAEVGEMREAVFAVTMPEQRGSFRRFCALVGPRNVTEFNYRISDSREAHIFVGVQVGSRSESGLLARTFGRQPGAPELHVLDSTVPSQVAAVEGRVDLDRTLIVVASKSGSTLEPSAFQRYFFARVAMLEHWQRESRLGHEEIARHGLERRAGRVGAALIVAGDDRAGPFPLDQDLRAAKHVTGRQKRHRYIADLERLAIGGGLRAALRRGAEPRLHHCDGLGRRQHMIVARARMIRMAMRDDGSLGAAIGVDMKPAGTAKEALVVDLEPAVKTVRFHFSKVCEEQITVSTHFRLQFATCNCGSASCAGAGC